MTKENLVEQIGDSYRLTRSGLLQITQALEEMGYLNCDDIPGDLEPNILMAKIYGSKMAEAAEHWLLDLKDEPIDDEVEETIVMLGLYILQVR